MSSGLSILSLIAEFSFLKVKCYSLHINTSFSLPLYPSMGIRLLLYLRYVVCYREHISLNYLLEIMILILWIYSQMLDCWSYDSAFNILGTSVSFSILASHPLLMVFIFNFCFIIADHFQKIIYNSPLSGCIIIGPTCILD